MRRLLALVVALALFAPVAHAQVAAVPVSSTVVEGSHVICARACNLYSYQVTTGATAGFLLLFNATAVPADGAVTPAACLEIPVNATANVAYLIPTRYTVGLVAVFSSTGCFTKTLSATAYFAFGTI